MSYKWFHIFAYLLSFIKVFTSLYFYFSLDTISSILYCNIYLIWFKYLINLLNYLDSINLIDISQKSIHINNYLNEYYQALSSLFDISQIEYIDGRRYNLVLSNDRIVMLPKVIDSELIYFIKNNIDLIKKSTNYAEFLDLRNFHKKTIRLK